MQERILERTHNFLRLYLHIAGQSDVPLEYHIWCCLSLVAACVADRVSLDFLKDKKTHPNLYIFLIGPSGCGKGRAIDTMLHLFDYDGNEWLADGIINRYRGALTGAHLMDRLGKKLLNERTGQYEIVNPKIFIVAPELSQSTKNKRIANELVKLLTELYGNPETQQDGTRMHGEVTVKRPCVNWIVGTTREWMMDSLTTDDVFGGPVARTVLVNKEVSLQQKYWRTIYPSDYEEVLEHLRARVKALCYAQGEFELLPNAEDYAERWFHARAVPEEPVLGPAFRRERELVLKLAMLFSLTDGGPLVVQTHHVQRAIKLSQQVKKDLPELIEIVGSKTYETAGIKLIEELLARRGEIIHSDLLRRVHKPPYNIVGKRLRAIMADLEQKHFVKKSTTNTGAMVYEWLGKRIKEVK